jgi:hypothetical protein
MDDTSVQRPPARGFALRKPLSGLARLVAASGLAAAGIVAGPLVQRASADVTYCRVCPGNAHGGPGPGPGSPLAWNTLQNNGN